MDLGLKGRNAVVLGGTVALERAIADTLAGEGATWRFARAMQM